jgi:hypothetical protein
MKYFSKQEQEALLDEGRAFDRKMIHRKYARLVRDQESARRLDGPSDDEGWMKYL